MSDQHAEEKEASRGFLGIDRNLWTVIGCTVALVALIGALVLLMMWFDNAIDETRADTAAKLHEKYGIDVVVPADRHDGATVWTIDGVERNCVWDGDTLTLACLGPTFTYTEIEKKR